MKLSEILRPLSIKSARGADGVQPDITSIHYRAQDVMPGGLFVAIPGHSADGHDYIDQALDQGASVIVVQRPVDRKGVVVVVDNTRRALSEISAQFYGYPAERLIMVGITGTNGKTTTAYLLERMLLQAGISAGVIGTINYRYISETFPNPVTTPESLDLQRIMSEMLNKGVTHAVLEVSSHALDLYRVAHCWLDIGIFTNLSQDHLDFHGNMNRYWRAKQGMFTEHMIQGPKADRCRAVINRNDMRGKELVEKLSIPVITYGSSEDNDVCAREVVQTIKGGSGEITTPRGRFSFQSNLVGAHNVENILGAVGAGIALKLPLSDIRSGIESLNGVPGRLESIPNRVGINILVDYAHTPNALENVLTAINALADGRVICVFGCGGDRDKDKRPQMGEIAGRFSDLTIITSDNPRSEPPLDIIDQVRAGVVRSAPEQYSRLQVKQGVTHKGHAVEPDRRLAIQLGIHACRPGDTVLIAGKGHETYQIIGKQTLSFDDRLEAETVLKDMGTEGNQTRDI